MTCLITPSLPERPDLRTARTPAVLRVEFLLQVVEQAFACIEYVLRVLLVLIRRVSGGKILQSKLLAFVTPNVLQGASFLMSLSCFMVRAV